MIKSVIARATLSFGALAALAALGGAGLKWF
jgi:hypothetical protein